MRSRSSPLILATIPHGQLAEHGSRDTLGRLVTPRHFPRTPDTAREGWTWAADNDGFDLRGPELGAAVWDEGKRARFAAMLGRIAHLPGCRFVSAPDVVGRADATAELFAEWEPVIRAHGLPVALVAQNGQETVPVPWERIDALFIGGDDAFKLGTTAAALMREAHARGLWVHVGRVNTPGRFRYLGSLGGVVDSVDGSSFAKHRRVLMPLGLAWASAAPQLRMIP